MVALDGGCLRGYGDSRLVVVPDYTEPGRAPAMTPVPPPYCPLARRLLAIAYDILLLAAVLFAATAAVLPLSGGRAIASGNLVYSLYLLAVAYLYFTWQWRHGGQTPGMRAWRVRVTNQTGGQPGWGRLSLRFFCALLSWLPCGGGFLCAAADRRRRTWHDRLSATELRSVTNH